MDALLIKHLEVEAKRLGMTRSQFIIDSVERALGRKDPYKLLLQVQEEMKDELAAERRATRRGAVVPAGRPPSTGDKVRAVLRKKRERLSEAA